jgi:hypothetical protein
LVKKIVSEKNNRGGKNAHLEKKNDPLAGEPTNSDNLLTLLRVSIVGGNSPLPLSHSVTRLGEFSPKGRLFTLGNFFITEVAHIFVLLFPYVGTRFVLILTKNVLGYILGDFSQTHLVTLLQNEFVYIQKLDDGVS